MNIIIINVYQMPQSACYFRNNSLRNYKLTLHAWPYVSNIEYGSLAALVLW